MPALQVANTLILPRLAVALPESVERSVVKIAPGRAGLEGAGFPVYRGFAELTMQDIDPFLMLDQLGPVLNGPFETKGAPWHPHRGFETVTYVLDGEIVHHDSNGGGGIIGDGDTQWMTAGAGILHDEVPSDKVLNTGGWQHGIQLWVNLPKTLKFSAPRYQGIVASKLTLTTSHDGGALVRIIAGDIAAHSGPGSTHTPIAIAHVTLAPGAQLVVPWNPEFNAMVYMLLGSATLGSKRHVLAPHHVALFGPGGHLMVSAGDQIADFLLLGGWPIREPVVQYGPFVMNTQDQIRQAFRDYEAGRLGRIPAQMG